MAALLAPWLLLASPSAADEPASPAPDTVIEIRVQGNLQVSKNAVLSEVRTRVGQSYDVNVIRADERRLLQTGKFRDVRVLAARTDKGLIVTFDVSERPIVAAIRFAGSKKYKDAELHKELTFAVGSPLDMDRVRRGLTAIQTKYLADGFYSVRVSIDTEALSDNQVVYDIVEGPRVTVSKIRFEFEAGKSFSAWRLRRQIKTSQAFWPFTRGNLDDQQVLLDVVSLRNYYRDEGFLDAEVFRKLDFSADGKKAVVTFVIREGSRYRVAEVRFEGNTVFPDRELLARLKMTRGEFHTAEALRRDTKALQDTYGEIGYLEAVVTSRRVFVSPEAPPPSWLKLQEGQKADLVIVVFRIEEDDQYRVGRITIRGNTITRDRVIRRQFRFFPEQLFNTVAVRESRQRLLETRLFDDVTITPYGNAPSVRDALVSVQEGRTAEFIVGVGFGSNTGVLGTISFTQRNFDLFNPPKSVGEFFRAQSFKGAGQTFRLNLEPGIEMTRARLDWQEPYLFDRPISLGTGLYLFTRGREDYDENRIGAQISLGKQFENRWYGELAVRVEDVDINNIESDAAPEVRAVMGSTLLLGMGGTLARDRTDSRWLPSRGDRFSIGYEQVIGDFSFGKAKVEYNIYRTVHMDSLDRKHILAGRISTSAIVSGDAPLFERYYGGGIGHVRGFSFRGISPRSMGTDKPIGGDWLAYIGGEYTFPVAGDNLRGVLFLDTGTVESDFKVTTWRASVGFGIRLQLPYFGPVPMSLDFGLPISKDALDDTQLVSFTFGWVF